MKNWQDITLGELVTFQRGHDLPESARELGLVPVVGSAGINGYHNKVKAKGPCVTVGRSGASIGKAFYIDQDFWPHNAALYVKDFKGNAPKFVYYYLSLLDFSYLNSGSAQPSLNRNILHKLKINVPCPESQKKIAAILSAYDDLIENNKRRITLLENMAEEIYREWFVRFRFPNYKNAEFEKGIPKGWEVKTFRDITTYYIGGGWGEEVESPTFTEGAYVIRGTDIPPLANGNYSNKVYRYHKSSNLQTRKLQKNDFVFEVSGGSTDQLLGRNLMVTEGLLSLFEDKVMCASFCKLIRFDKNQVSPFFMKYYLKLYYECDLVGIYQVQSTGISNYQFESFLNYQTLPIPNRVLLDEFDKLVMPIIKQQELLALSNAQLERTKNSLLPRLISGKLTVENLNIQFPPSMEM
jgi:type I restriction enzyme S subunit